MPIDGLASSIGLEKLLNNFKDNMIAAPEPSEQELFMHSYEPQFGISFTGGKNFSATESSLVLNFKDDLYFGILSYEAESISNTIINNYESIEAEEPIIDNFQIISGESETNSSIMYFHLPEQENEIISYKKPIEFQLSINDEITSAEDDYINSIPRKEIQFDILSSLGVIATEDAITESTTTGTSTEITSTTGVITDVGGPTATGTRTNILTDGTATRDVTIGSY